MTPDRPPRPTPTWFIDELNYASKENLDADPVARYDAKEDASAASEVALLKELGVSQHMDRSADFIYARFALHHLPDF